LWKGGWAILGVIALSAVAVTEAQAVNAWSPKPAQLAPYVNGNKPWTKLSDVLAGKDPSQSWRQLIVDDPNVSGTYVGMKVGDSTKGKLSADHRFAFIVWDGQVQVTIQGQTPFVATKGYMVQVPFRLEYTLKNVGSIPSLHFEIWAPEGTNLYPENAASLPPPPQGKDWYLSRIDAPDTYARLSTKLVFRDYLASPSQAEFMHDDRIFVNAIRGSGSSSPPNGSDPGHFHSYGEFWFIMEGRISYLIEGMSYFAATPGDIVYATPGRWHLAGNDPPTTLRSTRIAINGYPAGSHHWPVTQPAVPTEQLTPPATRAMLPSPTVNGWYLSPTVKLSGYPNASSSDDDLDYSEYWLDGALEPTRYVGPFKINGSGMHTLQYRSVDKAGNVEQAKTVTLGTIDLPPVTLQIVPSTLNLRTSSGLVTAVIAVPAGYDLRTWGVNDIRAQGSPAVSAAYSSDGRTIVATFSKAAFASVPASDAATVTVTGQFNFDGAQAPMAASTVVRVIR
jgi:mannose-6-phosphate isomerase-like protein (cupin superfamily)